MLHTLAQQGDERLAAFEGRHSLATVVSAVGTLPQGLVDGAIKRYQDVIRGNPWYFPTLRDVDMLRAAGMTDVYIAGVATDLAVEAAARSAHDNDFAVHVVTDASAAANQADHDKSLHVLPKFAQLVTTAEL